MIGAATNPTLAQCNLALFGGPSRVSIMILAAALVAGPVTGQDVPGERPHLALVGVRQVAALTTTEWDMEITMRGGTTLAEFEATLEGAFQGRLKSAGLEIDESTQDRLECAVALTLIEGTDPTVAVTRTVRLMEPETVDDPSGEWVVTWSTGRSWTEGRDVLSGTDVGQDCAAAFTDEWLRANSPGEANGTRRREHP